MHQLHSSRNFTGHCMIVQRGVTYTTKDVANLTNLQAKSLLEIRGAFNGEPKERR